MRTTLQRLVLFGLSFAGPGAVSALMLGCDQGCEVDATCVPEGWTIGSVDDVCPVDPADGPIRPDCGIWASARLGSDTRSGTPESPVRTIAKAVDLAHAGPKRVYACGEIYTEAVQLPSGISLYGGFDCEHGWVYTGTSKRAILSPDPGNIALILADGDGQSVVTDIEARSADALKPGGSSIAVLVQDAAKGKLVRAAIFAGRGADGPNGEDGDHNGFPSLKGSAGKSGEDACTSDVGIGGVTVTVSCGDGTFSAGGPGGDGGESAASAGADGLPLPDPNPANSGIGGKSQSAMFTCSAGSGGVQGINGQDGVPEGGWGRITKDGQVFGGGGHDGKPGAPGQGGGGGGGALGSLLVCGAAHPGGAGGGSGGSGGCGGRGGKGGVAGGSSIGLVVRGASFQFFDVWVTAGNGGNGGKGGQGQQGGQGGLPGAGGLGFGGGGGVQSGCGGGIGGNGGSGGDGAGGRGGHSVAVAYVGLVNVPLYGNSAMLFGEAGSGGYGGNPAIPSQNAPPGLQAPSGAFDP